MNRIGNIRGFTVIELVVVITIASLLFFFSVPVFKNIRLVSGGGSAAMDLAGLADELKERAVSQQADHQMHIDIPGNRVWITDARMAEDDLEKAQNNAIELPGSLAFQGIRFLSGTVRDSEAVIRFSRHGHSDCALIHLAEDGKYSTVRIEPFLLRATLERGQAEFENCD